MASKLQDQKLLAELKKIQKEFEDFVFTVSHDFKAPIRSIKNLSEWIKEDFGDQVPEEARKNLELIQNRVEKLTKMVDGMMELSRVGKGSLQVEPLNFEKCVQDIIQKLQLPEEVAVEIHSEIPEIKTDLSQFQQVLSRLIENAIKFNNSEHPRVELFAVEAGNFIEISVKDNGPGINTKYSEKIFKVFSSLIPQSQMENTGMGLPIAKKIIEDSGGTIELESKSKEGATFRFFWPKVMEENER